jgi:release factor glutamine methyltransferase
MENQIQGLTTERCRTIRGTLVAESQRLSTLGIETARLDAEVLLCHVLKVDKAQLYLNAESMLDAENERSFRELLMRRAKREPVAYITGRKEFWSLELAVTPDVLIPRPETELLVEEALERATQFSQNRPLRILDVGTGSGAIAVSLARELPDAQIWATDISAVALNIAGINIRRHGLESRIQLLEGDLFEPVAKRLATFDLIVSNPPYIRTGELSNLAPEIREWEPLTALDGGADGLGYYRRIIDEARNYLSVGGQVLVEIGADTAEAISELFQRAENYDTAFVYQDCAGKDRVIAAAKKASRVCATRDFGRG